MKIQQADIKDVEKIYELTRKTSYKIYQNEKLVDDWLAGAHNQKLIETRIKDPNHLMLVVKDTDVIACAYAKIAQDYDPKSNTDCGIGGLYIDENHRHQGIGTKLIDERLAWLRRKGGQRVHTAVSATNQAAISLLAQKGFTLCYQEQGETMPHITWNIMTFDLVR